MLKHVRLSAIAVVILAGTVVVGCAGPRSASTGAAAPTQTAAAPAGYMVPPGYVSGVRVLPYAGRIQSKCEHMTNEAQRRACTQGER
jgi:hypothetical protein